MSIYPQWTLLSEHPYVVGHKHYKQKNEKITKFYKWKLVNPPLMKSFKQTSVAMTFYYSQISGSVCRIEFICSVTLNYATPT